VFDDDVVAVEGLDLVIETGTVFGLLGSNGPGKSTTIKMLVTLLPMTSGEATVAGFDVRREASGLGASRHRSAAHFCFTMCTRRRLRRI
jgi:ABC-2 type transport system ATP-binding protein